MKKSFIFKNIMAALCAVHLCATHAVEVTAQGGFKEFAPSMMGSGQSLTSPAAAQVLLPTWFASRAASNVAASHDLHTALAAYCDSAASAQAAQLDAARAAFGRAVLAWEQLGAVAMGPQVQRRTARTVDFQPLRPAPFKAVLEQPPKTLVEMETVGGPAKGLAALEFLLFSEPVVPKTAHCAYATLAAAEIHQEFQALGRDVEAAAAQQSRSLPNFEANAELLNQWLGGLERLRWLGMDKPLRSATARRPAQLLRAASGLTVQGWAAHWQGLRALAAPSLPFLSQQGRELDRDLQQSLAAAAQAGQLHIASLLYVRGWERLAVRWLEAVLDVEVEMSKLAQSNLSPQALTLQTITPAVQSMTRLKVLLEGEVAPALQVTIGFSDADGD